METEQETEIEDVRDYYDLPGPHCVMAERRGANVLVLYKLKDKFKRLDGKLAGYELVYKWLAHETAELCRVQGSECSYYMAKELDLTKGLFDQFNLF